MVGIKAKLGNLLKLNVSEQLYLLLIASVFFSISVILGIEIWVFDNKIIEYSFAVSLFTSSIFLVLTIVFLSWLFNVRERAQWQNVRERVFSNIRLETGLLANHLFDFVIKTPEINDMVNRGDDLFYLIDNISEKTEISLDEGLTPIIFHEGTLWEFSDHQRELNVIEDRYFKFLSSEIVQSLMKIDEYLSQIHTTISLHKSAEALEKEALEQGIEITNGFKQRREKTELKMIAHYFKTLLLEIKILRRQIKEKN